MCDNRSDLFECLVECTYQVFNVLEPNGDTYQAIYNADSFAFGLFDIGVCHRHWMRD